MYAPYTLKKIGDLFGAAQYGDLTMLVCEVTDVSEVRLLDDLQNEESVLALGRTKEDLFKRWKIVHPNKPVEHNPLVFRISFRWTGQTETRPYRGGIEMEDAYFIDAINNAISFEIAEEAMCSSVSAKEAEENPSRN
jgi:hypothetical protein